MISFSRKCCLRFLLLFTLFHVTYSINDDTSTEGRRHSRVSGRIVKLYSGSKPNPIICQGEGFQADTVDCSVFYRCIKAFNGKYTVYRFQCGPGTVYDPDSEICNHPQRTKRSECGGLSSNKISQSTEGYKENEIESVHEENHELPYPISTKLPDSKNVISQTISTSKDNLLDNSYAATSDPFATTPKHVYAETSAVSWSAQTLVTTKSPWGYVPPQLTSYTTRQPSSPGGIQCTSDGFMGDTQDCRKFYRCVNNQRGGFMRYEFSCSESTIWDDSTQGCNHPWAVQRRRCGKGNSYETNSISYVNPINNNAPIENIGQQIIHDSENDNLHIQTSNNQTVNNFGESFSTEKSIIKQNQTQINYEWALSQSDMETGYGNKITQIQGQDYFNNVSQTVSQSSTSTTFSPEIYESENICRKDGFIGDSSDCKKFYRCVSNDRGGFNRHEYSCSEGTLWDDKVEACNHAWAVKECGKKTIQNIKPADAPIVNNTTTYSYSTVTSTSYISNDIEEVGYGSSKSPEKLEQPKSSTSSLNTQIYVTTENSTIDSTDCKSSGFFGNRNNCVTFYRCVENGNGRFTKYDYKCGDGTVWDPEIESCNHIWAVKNGCQNGSHKENIIAPNTENTIITTVSLIQTTTQRNIPDNDYDSGYGNTLQRETTAHSLIATASTERNQESKCTASGFIGDSKDCKKFYRCVDNGDGHYTRHEFLCGEGTVWDPEIEACNHASTVKQCGSSSINVSDDNNIQATTPLWVSENDPDSNNGYIPNKNNEEIETTTSKSSTLNTMSSSVVVENNKPNECETNGFMGDNNDCKIFYRCVDSGSGGFVRYTFSCGDGTVWDPKITACNHESQVEKCGKNTSAHGSSTTQPPPTNSVSSEMSTQSTALHTTVSSTTTLSTVSDSLNQCVANGFIGHKQDCKKFFRCVDDGKGSFTRYEFTCGEGTVWDPKISACNHAWAVESCGAYVSSAGERTSSHPPITAKDEETDNYVTQNNGAISSSSESNLGSSTTIKSTTTSNLSRQCDREGFVGDVDDCKKFYRCVNNGKAGFIRYEFSCGEGTVWDSEINACNHINSVKNPCSSQSIQTSKEPEPNYTVSSELESNNTATTPKEPLKSQECKQEGFIADNKDCKKFFRCTDNGEGGFYKYEFTCGEGTIWDQNILACNHESADRHCIPVSAEIQTQDSVTSVSSSTSYPDETHSTEKIEITTNADECTSEGFYANSSDCKKFFRCVGDGKGGFTKYDFTCGDGTIWVQDIQACDHDNDLSHCNKATPMTTSTSSTPSSITPSEASKETPISPISTPTSTSTEESQTKPTMQDELEPGSSSTTESSISTNNDICDESGYFGNTKDCKKFYRCVDNSKGGYTKYDYTCGDGTIWDQDITACNHPQDVSNPSCRNEETNTGTTTTMSSESSESTTKGTSSSESLTDSTSTTITTTSSNQGTQDVSTKKPNTNYTCTEAGFYADPYDCKKFYRCVNWGDDENTFSIYHFDCGEGTIWDPALETCNHEDSVYPPRDCSGTQSQNENNTDTTTTEGTTTKQEETTESSSTEKSTTTQSTTPKATTESSSIGTSTTVQTSTQQSSTSESQQSTTQQSTTEQSTTKQSTTEQSTTPQSTTTSEQTTNQQSSTTQKSTTAEQSTSTTTEQTTTDHTTTDQTTTTEQTTTTSSSTERTTTSSQASSSESATSTTEQTTTEQSSENQSSTTEESSTTLEPTEATSTTEGGQDTTTEKETTDKDCPETDDDQYLYVCPTGFKRHPKYCNLFYQCTEDDDSHEVKVAVFTCPNNTIYDESKIQCVEEQNADKKCEGKIAQRRRVKRLDTNYKEPIIVSKDTYTCPSKGHFPFEKNEECSTVLFKCEITKSGKLRGIVYQCPEGYVYWSISRRCEPLNAMTHCKRSLSNWNGRYELPVEKRNVARETTIK